MGAGDTQAENIPSSAKTEGYCSHRMWRPMGGRTKSLGGQTMQCRATRFEKMQRKAFTVPRVQEKYVSQEHIYDLLSDSRNAGNRLSPYVPLPTIGSRVQTGTVESQKMETCDMIDITNTEHPRNPPTPEKNVCDPKIESLTISECAPTKTASRERTYNVLEPRYVKRPCSLQSSSDTLVFGPRVGANGELQGPIKLWDSANSHNQANHHRHLGIDTNKPHAAESVWFSV